MNSFVQETDELNRLSQALPDYLRNEVQKIINTDDEVVILLYSRRSLEMLVRQICEKESIKISDTIPLKGIIDKLIKEQKVPSNIGTAMLNLNSISTYGAHPKEFDPRQVKSALNDLATILEWFLNYSSDWLSHADVYKPFKKEIEKRKPIKQNKKLIGSISFVVMVVVLVFIGFYDVFGIFQKDEFNDLRDDEGRISVAVMPFQNLTNDTLWNIWQQGIQNELISKLTNSEELAVLQYQTMFDLVNNSNVEMASFSTNLASKLSKQVEAAVFVFGTIKKSGKKIRLNAQLIEPESMKVYKSFEIDGKSEDDIFVMVDSLTFLIKSDLEIQSIEEKNKDIAPMGNRTKSVKAYRNVIEAIKAFSLADYDGAIKLLNDALKIDSNYTAARIALAISYGNSGNIKLSKYHIKKSYDQFENLSKIDQLMLCAFNALYEKNIAGMIKYNEELLKLAPQKFGWYNQGWNYFTIENYEEAVNYCEKALELDKISGGNWKWLSGYYVPAQAYHKLGNHERENEIYELGLSARPDHPYLVRLQVICALSQGDTVVAFAKMKKLKALRKESGWKEYQLLNELGEIYREAENLKEAADYFKESIEKNASYYWSRYNLIHLYFSKNENMDEGFKHLKVLVKNYPEDYYTIYLEGYEAYLKGNYKEAKELLNKAWELRPWYNHEHFKLMEQVEQKLTEKNE